MTIPLATTMPTSASTSYHTFMNSNPGPEATTSTAQFHDWQPGNKRKRRCGACKEAEEMVIVALEKTTEQDACICKYMCCSENTWLINNIRNSSNT